MKLPDLADESTSTIFVGTRLESGTSVGAHVWSVKGFVKSLP